jgi:hypothetical protein
MPENIVTVELTALPGQLRKGDLVLKPGLEFVLTETPRLEYMTYAGHECPVYVLTGTNTRHVFGQSCDVTTVMSAQIGVCATRSYHLNGRQAPVFSPVKRTEPCDWSLIY